VSLLRLRYGVEIQISPLSRLSINKKGTEAVRKDPE